jgi:hypothetical protein
VIRWSIMLSLKITFSGPAFKRHHVNLGHRGPNTDSTKMIASLTIREKQAQRGANALRLSSWGGICRTSAGPSPDKHMQRLCRCSVSTVFLNYCGSGRVACLENASVLFRPD